MQTELRAVLAHWDRALCAVDGWWRENVLPEVRLTLIDSWLTGAPRASHGGLIHVGSFSTALNLLLKALARYKVARPSPPPVSRPLSLQLKLVLTQSERGYLKGTTFLLDGKGLALAEGSAFLAQSSSSTVSITEISLPSTSPKPTSTECTCSHLYAYEKDLGSQHIPSCPSYRQKVGKKKVKDTESYQLHETCYSKEELLTLLRKNAAKCPMETWQIREVARWLNAL